MTKNKKNIAIFLMTLFVVGFSVFSFSGNIQAQETGWNSNLEGGLIKCGRDGVYNNRCRLCDLIVGIKGIIDWGRTILVAVALTAITAGGIMYIISAGDEQMMQAAKNVIKQALWGVVIVLGAWLIVNTTMYLLATKGSETGDVEGGTLGVKAAGWNKFSCTGGGEEGGEFTNEYPSCGSTPSTCTPGIPSTSCDGSWTCTNNLNDSVTCPSLTIGECSLAKFDCVTGCVENQQNNIDGGASWTCRGGLSTDSCTYSPPRCNESEPCRCESGEVANCVNAGGTSATWVCISGNDQESCSWQCTENQQGCSSGPECCSGTCDFTGVVPPQQGTCIDNSSTFCHELDPSGICLAQSDCGGGGYLVPYSGYESSCNNPPASPGGSSHIGETCCINPANLP